MLERGRESRSWSASGDFCGAPCGGSWSRGGQVSKRDSAGLGQGVEGEGVVDFDEAFAVVAVSFGEIEGAGFASAFNRSPMLSLLSFSS